MIPSENYASRAVMAATGSIMTKKYAEGYPGARYYHGCEHVDAMEALAIERAKQSFGADHANVQPVSGTQANMAVYYGLLEPGDTMMAMSPRSGRTSLPRLQGEFFRPVLPLRPLWGRSRDGADRL